MSDKSEALKLADVVEVFDAKSERLPLELYSDISSELRRLHEVNQELLFWMRYILSKDHVGHIHDTARAAIAKATGEKA